MQKTYDKHTAKFIAAVAENMPRLTSEQMQAWIQSPLVLASVLAKLDQPMVDGRLPTFQVWKTITIGGMTNEQLLTELKRIDVFVDETMLRGCTEIREKHTVDLIKVSTKDLGFVTATASYPKPSLRVVLARIKEVGLNYHAAVGPYLRLQYREQPKNTGNDFVVIASEPLPVELRDDSYKAIWYLDNHEGELTLIEDGSEAGWEYTPGELICILGEMRPVK